MKAVMDRPVDQRMNALAEANRVRIARSKTKQAIKNDPMRILELLDRTPDWMASAKVMEFLCAIPFVGPAKVDRIFRLHGISSSKTMGGLTSRQRSALIGDLGMFLDRGRPLPAGEFRREREDRAVRAAEVAKPKPKAKAKAKRPDRRFCVSCGERLRQPSRSGQCGFCEIELAA